MRNINLTDEQFDYLQASLRQDVQNFYDDPDGWLGESRPSSALVKAEIDRLCDLLTIFGLDFEAVAKEEATDNEINRVKEMLRIPK